MSRILFLLALALGGCDPTLPAVNERCSATAECPLDQFCRVATGQCIAVTQNTLGGEFACTVIGQGDTFNPGPSSVVGRFESQELGLTFEATCKIVEDTLKIRLNALPADPLAGGSLVGLLVDLRSTTPVDGSEIRLAESVMGYGQFGASRLELSQQTGVSALGVFDGTLRLQGSAAIGGRLRGYVEGQLRPVEGRNEVGIPCQSVRACGGDLSLLCQPVVENGPALCGAFCDEIGAATCELYGGKCVEGYCLRPCDQEACPAGTTCGAVEQGSEVCL
jgi:hypothetical protein